MNMVRIQNILLTGLLLVGVSCYAAQAEAPDVVNTNCPIGGEAVEADGGTAEWNGKNVGFCCEKCVAKWDTLDDEAKAAALEAAQ